jgi:hypothetical protein
MGLRYADRGSPTKAARYDPLPEVEMKTWIRNTWLRTALVVGFALLPVSLAGQAPTAAGLASGNRIRATYRVPMAAGDQEATMEGTFVGVAADGIRLSTGSALDAGFESRTRAIPLDDLVRLEVRGEPSAGRGAMRGALVGGLIGAVAGLGMSVAVCSDPFFSPCSGMEYLSMTAVVGGVGAGIGAGIGALIRRSGWEEVPVDN